MKIFLDENLSPSLSEMLLAQGYQATSAFAQKLSGAEDYVIREYCIKHDYILVTLDADFGNVIKFPPSGTSGVIWIRPSLLSNKHIISLLLNTLRQLQNTNLNDMLAVVDENNIRIRPGILSS